MLGALLVAGATLAGGVLQSKSADKATNAQVTAQREAIAAREKAAQQVQALNAPGAAVYGTALNALTGRVGLQSPMSAATSTASGVDGFDADAYMQLYPDVAQRAAEGVAEGLIGPGKQWQSPQEWAAFHYTNSGRAEGRQAPTAQAAPQENALGGVSPGSYGTSANLPEYATPAAFSFDINSFKDNPAYKFALDQGSGQVLANASATGALGSGAALKRLQDRGQQTAYNFFSDERDSAFNRYNTDRNFGRSVFESDRGYLTNRYDRTTDDMFRVLGVGQNALNATSNALTGSANATATGLENIGQSTAANAVAQGNIWSNALGGLAGQAAGVLNGNDSKQNALAGYLRGAADQNPYLF